ncbi:MAG: hypothetical protein P4L99_27045 [Chthoniobacter sp.]|nr:hypothetical protein [Chthoniobacter sp.]
MPVELLSRKRVSVQQDPYCFVVLVDSEPVLRCLGRRDALRYAVMIRRALLRTDLLERQGTLGSRSPGTHKIPN